MLKRDGTVWTAGNESAVPPDVKRLGAGDTLSSTSWVMIGDQATYVEAGTDQSLFIKSDGSLWMFGSNAFGQIGPPERFPEQEYSVPVKVASGVSMAATEYRFSAAVHVDGRLEVWGDVGGAGSYVAPGHATTAHLAVGCFHLLYLNPRAYLYGLGTDGSGELMQPTSKEVGWQDLGWSPR